ncbi:DUF4038 domain-containing protein [Actinopolymorpha sp. B11F2]|uniref:apiosidase-like domain-containing protein n=1 Tax=Actinopolymorpha sp. B11F2 TaxID=3160862 RepID=UPI0032E50627
MTFPEVERWGVHDVVLEGPAAGNPFADVVLTARFQHLNRVVEVAGFYDGDGTYRIRFSPDREGHWRFVTSSNVPALDSRRGEFVCVAPGPGNHGPVRVVDRYHFSYADGTRYLPVGTTCYHWTHQMDEEHEESTLRSLARSPFTKVRMCVLPTGGMRPPALAFECDTPGKLDKTRFNPRFFAHLERRIADLCALGIVADVILLHPYDKGVWGVDDMTPEQDRYYLRYVVARLAAFRNVWWSMANEYDFNTNKTVADWDALLRYLQRLDPYARLRSIHNGTRMYEWAAVYDFTKPWLTHQSIQHWDATQVGQWREACAKPVVIDEICYEGDIERRWGNISGREMTRRFWLGTVAGGYVGHGECFVDSAYGRWVSRGGVLSGESPARIAFLRRILEEGPADWSRARQVGTYWLEYLGDRQPAFHSVELPDGGDYAIDVIDTWEMTVTPYGGRHRGHCRVPVGRTDLALRVKKVTG